MKREDIRRMAREAGYFFYDLTETHGIKTVETDEHDQWAQIERFAALVAAHERNSAIEQCERLKWKSRKSEYLEGMDAAYENVIKWLLARGEK